MEPLQYLALTAQDLEPSRSALPTAPVVPFVPRPQHARRTRGVLANTLHRLGDAIAPAPASVSEARVA